MIVVKEVLDEEGGFSHLELWQGDNVIKISLSDTSLTSSRKNDRWNTLKEMIDKIVERRRNNG